MLVGIRNGSAFIILLISVPSSYGQTTVWLSDNATFADLDLTTTASPGTTGSFDIWIKTEHSNRLFSIGMDLLTTGSAIRLTGADIVIGTSRFVVFGTTVADDGSMIENMSAYAGLGLDLGTGIGLGVPVDNDALSAYKFATIHYRIAGSGTSDLQLKVGQFIFDWGLGGPNVLHLGIDDPITIGHVPGATDGIIDGRIHVVPEVSSVGLLLIGGSLLLMKRFVGF